MDVKKITSKLDKLKPEKSEEQTDEMYEVKPEVVENKVSVKIDTLREYADIDRIQATVREGNIVFLKIKDLRMKDISELKRCVDKLRKTALAMNGDIVGVDEDFLVLTPSFAKIYRGKSA
jgi:SepF-like predicted cell division protein (DUF552 family)